MSTNDSILTHSHEKEQGNLNEETSKLNEFLKSYDSCFVDAILDELPPSWGLDDYMIDIIQGSYPVTKASYCVSMDQQEEIMSQVN